MKMIKMHQNAVICIRMRMLKNNTTFVKKQHLSHLWELTWARVSLWFERLPGELGRYRRYQAARALSGMLSPPPDSIIAATASDWDVTATREARATRRRRKRTERAAMEPETNTSG